MLGVDDTVVRHRRHRGADRLGQYLPAVDPQTQGVHIGADKTVLAFGPGLTTSINWGEHSFRRVHKPADIIQICESVPN